MFQRLNNIDFRIIPKQEGYRYEPYMWLVYLFIFFASLVQYHPIEHSFVYAAIGTCAFLILYFNSFWVPSKRIKWNIMGIVIVAITMTILSPGASVFYVYAASFCSRLGSKQKAVTGLILIAVTIIVVAWFGNYGVSFLAPALIFTFFIGTINIHQHELDLKRTELMLSQQEVKHLARASERERIARDLHDLIGHTFSVITLKAELANKLIHKDIDKAQAEISALEHISRDALSQIREVVTGYRTSDLNTELAHAKYVLESHNINFNYQLNIKTVSEIINKEIAIMLKELITNILKHAQASRVKVKIEELNNNISLFVKDDGLGFKTDKTKGYGLKGLGERVDKLTGTLSVESSSGTEININIPLRNNDD